MDVWTKCNECGFQHHSVIGSEIQHMSSGSCPGCGTKRGPRTVIGGPKPSWWDDSAPNEAPGELQERSDR